MHQLDTKDYRSLSYTLSEKRDLMEPIALTWWKELSAYITPSRRKETNRNRRYFAKVLLCNLFEALRHRQYLTFSIEELARRDFYNTSEVMPVLKAAQSLGYLTYRRGHKFTSQQKGMPSKIFLTEKTVDLFVGLDYPEIGIDNIRASLIVRDKEKQEIEMVKNKQNRRKWDEVDVYNAKMDEHQVILSLTPEQLIDFTEDELITLGRQQQSFYGTLSYYLSSNPTLISSLSLSSSLISILSLYYSLSIESEDWSDLARGCPPEAPGSEHLSTTSCLLYPPLNVAIGARHSRIFNDGSIRLGGRYTSPYQFIFNELRPASLSIDGKPLVELDYCSLQLAQLYNKKALPTPTYGYSISGIPESKKAWKYSTITCINSSNRENAIGAIQIDLNTEKSFLPLKPMTASAVISEIELAFPEVSEMFFVGHGKTLQYEESQHLAAPLVRYFCLQRDIPILVIHDSFLIWEEYKDELYYQMSKNYQDKYGFVPFIEQK